MSRPPAFPAEEKIRIVLPILAGETTVAEAARRSKVSEQYVGNWNGSSCEPAWSLLSVRDTRGLRESSKGWAGARPMCAGRRGRVVARGHAPTSGDVMAHDDVGGFGRGGWATVEERLREIGRRSCPRVR